MARQITTVKDCAQALRNTGGFITAAAKQLGISQPALSKRISKSAKLKAVVEETKEQYLDLAESQLVKAIKDRESWAICFYLKCKGKQRGYVEKQEVDYSSSDGSMSPKETKITTINLSHLNDDELQSLSTVMDKIQIPDAEAV